MPVQRRFDFQLAGKGFMLSRNTTTGRSWHRSGQADVPSQRTQSDARYGVLPSEIDHPEVWDDWSGGYGYAYRRAPENTYNWSENFDSRFPRQLIHAQQVIQLGSAVASFAGRVNGFEIVQTQPNAVGATNRGAGALLIQGINQVMALVPDGLDYNGADGGFDISEYAITQLPGIGKPALFGSAVYWPTIDGSGFFRTWHSGIFAGRAASGNLGFGFCMANGRMWKFAGPDTARPVYVQSNTDNTFSGPLMPANWSATLGPIGNGWYGIQDMVSYFGQVMIGLPDGVYAGDLSGTFVNVFATSAVAANVDNFRNMEIHNGSLIGQSVAGIFSYEANAITARVTYLGPPMSSRSSPILGTPVALSSYGGWLYAGIWTGSQTHLIAGRQNDKGWSWHSMQRLPTVSRARRIFCDSITTSSGGLRPVSPRMWILTEATVNAASSAPVCLVPMPRLNGNPLVPSDPGFSPNYTMSARIDLGSVDWNAPATSKIMRAVEVWADNLASGAQWCQVYYDVDHSGSFTLLGISAKSPIDTIYFPSGEGSFVTGQSIELSLRSFTASQAITPVYRSIVLRGALQPRSSDTIVAVVRIADNMSDRQNNTMRSAATMIQELRDFGNPDAQGLQAHQLIDLSGATQWVKVLGRIDEQEVYQAGSDNPEIAATVRMAVLTYS